jgi:hypothetical protein
MIPKAANHPDNCFTPVCFYRQLRGTEEGYLPICRCQECDKFKQPVSAATCTACKFRKALPFTLPFTLPFPMPVAVSVAVAVPRPDLQAIETTLPAANPIKDATFRRPVFHTDGSIEYPKGPKDWEPPQNIDGWVRDTNKWKFLPLFLPCQLRHQSAFLKASCGCVNVISRCNNPQAPPFGQRVSHETCAACTKRQG